MKEVTLNLIGLTVRLLMWVIKSCLSSTYLTRAIVMCDMKRFSGGKSVLRDMSICFCSWNISFPAIFIQTIFGFLCDTKVPAFCSFVSKALNFICVRSSSVFFSVSSEISPRNFSVRWRFSNSVSLPVNFLFWTRGWRRAISLTTSGGGSIAMNARVIIGIYFGTIAVVL